MTDDQSLISSKDYQEFLTAIKNQIQTARIRAALAVNSELILHYWQLGKDIAQKFEEQGWGAKIIDRIAADLNMKGYSPRNLRYMRSFAEAWPDKQILQAVPAKITWYHNCTLLDKVKSSEEREWYIRKTIEHGWSRDILVLQIENGAYQRQGKADTNFTRTLPPPQSDLARQMLKDPYNFNFLDLGDEAQEREVERGLTEHIREFLIELGSGFAFMGSQYHIEVRGKDYYIDLMFYHVKLRCYVVIDLKATEFKPEYVGKMNFYLSAIDDLLRHSDDQPSIGMILCKTKDSFEAEYALRDINKPIGIAGFQLTKALPENLKGSLPTIEELEAHLGDKILDEE